MVLRIPAAAGFTEQDEKPQAEWSREEMQQDIETDSPETGTAGKELHH